MSGYILSLLQNSCLCEITLAIPKTFHFPKFRMFTCVLCQKIFTIKNKSIAFHFVVIPNARHICFSFDVVKTCRLIGQSLAFNHRRCRRKRVLATKDILLSWIFAPFTVRVKLRGHVAVHFIRMARTGSKQRNAGVFTQTPSANFI